jgi:DUF1680 family protein
MNKNYFAQLLIIILLIFVSCKNISSEIEDKASDLKQLSIQPEVILLQPHNIKIEGFLGEAINISAQGRLLALPSWNDGQLIKIFSPEARLKSTTNDWYGEHAGKWMYTTALAANRTGDEKLKSLLLRTADYLVSTQEKDGYLGTYSPDRRITNPDYSSFNRSWDVWNLSYMVLGLLETHKYFPNESYLSAAKKIGELFLKTFGQNKQNITDYGTRKGISATIILDPSVELYRVTGDHRYLDFAIHVIRRMEEKEELKLISAMLQNSDLSTVGDGKAYQLCWNLTAIAKLYQMTGNEDYLKSVENAWSNIVDYHLTVTGGPWGGIGNHLECFNRQGFWSPFGFLETCNTMSWIQFNREMFRITGEAKYAQEIEKSAYNALIGAQYPNGIDWCYHSFDNGRRHIARFQACCSSSGAMALEELAPLIYSIKGKGISCNIYTESEASLILAESKRIRIVQETEYPFKGDIIISILPENESSFPLYLRIPEWADRVKISVNGQDVETNNIKQGDYFTIERTWKEGDKVNINLPFDLKFLHKNEDSNTPRAGSVPIFRMNWYSINRGPLVYSTNGLIGGQERDRMKTLPEYKPETYFVPVPGPAGIKGQAFELKIPNCQSQLFVPYFEAGNRISGSWRLTWLQNNIDDSLSGEW